MGEFLGLPMFCFVVVVVFPGNRAADDDMGFTLSPVSIASTDAAPGCSIIPFDPDILKLNLDR